MSRTLLTRTEAAGLRAMARTDGLSPHSSERVLDAYETAVRLLEEAVRDVTSAPGAPFGPLDVAWLALREAER